MESATLWKIQLNLPHPHNINGQNILTLVFNSGFTCEETIKKHAILHSHVSIVYFHTYDNSFLSLLVSYFLCYTLNSQIHVSCTAVLKSFMALLKWMHKQIFLTELWVVETLNSSILKDWVHKKYLLKIFGQISKNKIPYAVFTTWNSRLLILYLPLTWTILNKYRFIKLIPE